MMIRYHEGEKKRLLAVEIHNGRDSGRITQQLAEYVDFINQSIFEDAYGHETMMFVLSVHEQVSTLRAVRERLRDVLQKEDLVPFFLFNTQTQVRENFGQHWALVQNGENALFK